MPFPAAVPRPRLPLPLRWLLLAVWSVAGCAAGAGAAQPPDPHGSWEVIQVAVDHRDQPHWAYYPDDPRLLGRQLQITPAGISLDDDSRACMQPRLSSLAPATPGDFIGQRLARPPRFDTPTAPTPGDFGLTLPDAEVTALQVACTPDGSPWNGAWLLPLPDGRLLTNYDNSGYVLVLQRRAQGDPIHASFACAKAHSVVEQAICASPSLAGYDRSVAAAYRRAQGLAGDDAGTLKQEQIRWLQGRNACGANADCLAQKMRERVDQLMQQ